jgi:hypothetical protein
MWKNSAVYIGMEVTPRNVHRIVYVYQILVIFNYTTTFPFCAVGTEKALDIIDIHQLLTSQVDVGALGSGTIDK